jgi:hypothetical protein
LSYARRHRIYSEILINAAELTTVGRPVLVASTQQRIVQQVDKWKNENLFSENFSNQIETKTSEQ